MSAAQSAGAPKASLPGSVATQPPPPGAASVFDRFTERQMSLLVIGLGIILYIPFAGSYGLWDPWETHYSEVARQIVARGDFISLWWPGSPRDADVFWSKPVLTFWLMAIGMLFARVGLRGGDPGEMALTHRAEWAVRVPFCLLGVLAMWGVYLVVSRFVSRRAGFLSALVMATCPMFSLVARQAMTDMAFVGPMTLALALGTIALLDDEDRVLPRRGRGLWSWPHDGLFYATVGFFALITVPQLIVDSVQLKVKVPLGGSERLMYGIVVMWPYWLGFAAFVFLAARARYKAPLYLYVAAMLCGLAVLAKGLAGLGLPVIVFLAYLGFTWNWKRLRRAQLPWAVLVSLLAVVVVAAPWHHAMIARHGWAFWNELFGDNHWRRMVLGRHGDRGTFEYFLRELGYAVLPWVALAPAALATMVMRRVTDQEARKQAVYWLGAIWFVSAYAVVSASVTKFHHYVLPAIPGLAIVIGCYLDDLVQRRDVRRGLIAALVGIPLLALVAQDLINTKNASQHFLWLFSYDYIHSPHGRPWPDQLDFTPTLLVYTAVFAVLTGALAVRRLVRPAVVGLGVASVFFTWFLLDGYMRKVAPFWSQKDTIATYYQARRSPEEKLIAYQMYWRGETFYTKNAIYEGPMEDRTVFDMDGADEKLTEWLNHHRHHRVFFLFERGRQAHLQSLLPPETRGTFQVLDEHNNKFSLAQADI
jgi:4-amino-4-deoxy-L-arabinose transferase-like glycosyltransferase